MTNKWIGVFSCHTCAPCKQINPMCKSLSEEAGIECQIFSLESDLDKFHKYGIRGTPIVVLFDDEKQIERVVGTQTYTSLRNKFIKWGLLDE